MDQFDLQTKVKFFKKIIAFSNNNLVVNKEKNKNIIGIGDTFSKIADSNISLKNSNYNNKVNGNNENEKAKFYENKSNYINKLYKDKLLEMYYEVNFHNYKNLNKETTTDILSNITNNSTNGIISTFNNTQNKGFVFSCQQCKKYFENAKEYRLVKLKSNKNDISLFVKCTSCNKIKKQILKMK